LIIDPATSPVTMSSMASIWLGTVRSEVTSTISEVESEQLAEKSAKSDRRVSRESKAGRNDTTTALYQVGSGASSRRRALHSVAIHLA